MTGSGTKRARAPTIVGPHNDEADQDESTTSASESDDTASSAHATEDEELHADVLPAHTAAGPPSRIILSLAAAKAEKVCKVCGKPGHQAGFVGSVYMDCINKPCYLCKQPGHTTTTCPFRLQPGHGSRPEAGRVSSGGAGGAAPLGVLHRLQQRELCGSRRRLGSGLRPPEYAVQAAILKLHSRRVSCLEFHPSLDKAHLVFSGDKKGVLACWDMDKVDERTLYRDTHKYQASGIKFLPWVDEAAAATSSLDGTVTVLDVETGLSRQLLDLNPGGYTTDKEWRMLYGVDAAPDLHLVVVGDSDGRVHFLDPRARGTVASPQLHRRANKVVSVAVNPVEPRLLLTAGNDHTARLCDMRRLTTGGSEAGGAGGAGPSSGPAAGGAKPGGKRGGSKADVAHPAQLLSLPHPRVVNSALFSPHSGRKVLTTCQDNRIRVWDSLWPAGGAIGGSPDREIVHSHDFNRYLTAFRAEWDPKDLNENRFVIGRYISEDVGGVALHPVDLLDAGTGALLRALFDHNMTTIAPVNKAHPSRDVIVSGSSRSLFLWAPVPEDTHEEAEVEAASGPGVAGPSSGGGGARPGLRYHFFDADPGSSDGKKKGGKGKGKTAEQQDDDSD